MELLPGKKYLSGSPGERGACYLQEFCDECNKPGDVIEFWPPQEYDTSASCKVCKACLIKAIGLFVGE